MKLTLISTMLNKLFVEHDQKYIEKTQCHGNNTLKFGGGGKSGSSIGCNGNTIIANLN